MVLHLKEFAEKHCSLGQTLNYYNEELPEYLHEMPVEEIIKQISRNGEKGAYNQKRAVLKYLEWLSLNYGIDVSDKHYEIYHTDSEKINIYKDILTLEQLKIAIEENLNIIENGTTKRLIDFSGMKAIFFLEWYGVLPKSAITIKLTDVSNDGKQVYIPAENRGINIDDEDVARYFSEYKQKTGFKRSPRYKKETLYVQDTFYRNTSSRGDAIKEKTIYNARRDFISGCGDKRFSQDRVYFSGRFNAMLKAEYKLNMEFSASDEESVKIIKEIFNDKTLEYSDITDYLRSYAAYKRAYLA